MKKQKSGLYEKSLIRIILFLCINFIHFPLYGYYFKNIGVKYEVIKSLVEEKSDGTDPSEYVKDLSKDKANSVASQINEKAIIISADSIIYMNGKIYEKPKSKEEAYQNLKEMSGKITYAVTGVTIKDLYKNEEICFADIAEVHLKEIDDEDIK